jgi:hypothetical protein
MTDSATTAAPDEDLQRRAEAKVGPREEYVQRKLVERYHEVSQLDPVSIGSWEEWKARVAGTYRPRFEAKWAEDVGHHRFLLDLERGRQEREATARRLAVGWPLRPYAADVVCIGIWPPTGWYQSRPLFVLLPLAAPGARGLMERLGLGEADVPDFSEPYWAGRLGYHGNPARLPRGKALVLGTTLDPLGDGPYLPDTFDPEAAVTWTRELARRPPSLDELRAKAEAERRARADAEAAGRLRDKEAEEKRREEERLRRSPLAKIADLERQLRDVVARQEDGEARAQAERLRRELDELLARRRNGHQP